MAKSKVNWYDKNVMLEVENATDDILTAAAFQVEGYAKVDAPVDTGFLRNAIYTVAADGESRRGKTDPDGYYKSKKTGQTSWHSKASQPPKKKHDAMVHAAANYTIYNEMHKSFLYKALNKVKKEVNGIIKTVAKEHNLD